MLDSVKSAPSRARDNVSGWWQNTRTFFAEVRNEMKRVTWPSKKEVYATTVVVILTTIFFGFYLYGLDVIMSQLFTRILAVLQ